MTEHPFIPYRPPRLPLNEMLRRAADFYAEMDRRRGPGCHELLSSCYPRVP